MRTDVHTIAWQGWSAVVPIEWNPAGLDGDADDGVLMLADLHGPRLGVRWSQPRRRESPQAAVDRAIASEGGDDAVPAAVAPRPGRWAAERLWVADDDSGRALWAGVSATSGRLLQLSFTDAPGDEADSVAVLESLVEAAADDAWSWSVFDLRFVTPQGWGVRSTRLLAGDLAVLLRPRSADRPSVVLRQVSPATLALARRPLEHWADRLPFTTPRLQCRPTLAPLRRTLGGRPVDGVGGTVLRKRRLWWAWFVPARQHVVALYDRDANRLVIASGEREEDVDAVLATV